MFSILRQRGKSLCTQLQYTNISYFKVDFHNLSIRAKKDAARTWHNLPYLVAKEHILGFINKWSSEWLTPSDEGTRTSEVIKGRMGKTTAMKITKKDKEKEAPKASRKEKAVQKNESLYKREGSAKGESSDNIAGHS